MSKANSRVYKVGKILDGIVVGTESKRPFFERKTDKPREKFPAGRQNTRIAAFLPDQSPYRENFFSNIDILLRESRNSEGKKRAISIPPPLLSFHGRRERKNRRKTGGRERERGPEPFGLGFSDLCLRPRPLFVPPPAKKRNEIGGRKGRGEGRMRRLEQKVQTPPVYVRMFRISRVNLTPEKLSPSNHVPLHPRFQDRPDTIFTRVRPAFSFQPANSRARRKGGREGISFTIGQFLCAGREGGRYGLIRFWTRVFFNRRFIVDQTLLILRIGGSEFLVRIFLERESCRQG